MNGPRWQLGVSVPPGWLRVRPELPEHERRRELAAQLDGQLRTRPHLEPHANRLLDLAESLATAAFERGAFFFAVGFEHVQVDVIAMSAAMYGCRGEATPDLAALADELRSSSRHGPAPEVSLVHLPIGPALRVHAVAEAGPPDNVGDVVLVEGLDHFIPVPTSTDMVLLSCMTPSVLAGEQVVPVFERIAETVVLVPQQERTGGS